MYIYVYICIYIHINVIMKTMCPPGYHHNAGTNEPKSAQQAKNLIKCIQ